MLQLWSRSKLPFAVWKVANGKTDTDLAAVCRVHAMTINKWINGKGPVPFAVAKLLAETIEKTVPELFEERTVPAPRSGRERQVDAAIGNVMRGTRADTKAAS